MAAAPRPRSGASWNPAVPPPPVAGAAVTTGLAVWRGVADATAEGVPLALDVLPLDVLPLGVLLARSAGVVEAAPEGDNGVVEADGKVCAGADPEQAETDKDASMVKLAQPTASLAPGLVPVMVVRIFTGLLMPAEGGGYHSRSRYRKEIAAWPGGAARAGGHKGKAHRRRRRAMACSSLEY
jgi:hypothetical protein